MPPRSTHAVRMVGARELKTRLGAYLRQVREGARIVVTDRGEPVAELRPLETGRGDHSELEKLVAIGMISRASRGPLSPFKPIRHAGRPLADSVVEERRDRF